MNVAQRRSIMKAFICSQFGYCPLVWMFHSRKMNNRVKSLHERALRVVYRDYNATFSELLSIDKSVIIHQINLQLLATEIFETKIGNLKTVYYGTESLTNLGAKI